MTDKELKHILQITEQALGRMEQRYANATGDIRREFAELVVELMAIRDKLRAEQAQQGTSEF